jgi:hypothetical protein
MLRAIFFLATQSLKHNTASYTPNVSVSSLKKAVMDIFVQMTEFKLSLGFSVFP